MRRAGAGSEIWGEVGSLEEEPGLVLGMKTHGARAERARSFVRGAFSVGLEEVPVQAYCLRWR